MSELKDYSILDIEAIDDERLEKCKSGKIQETRVYIKSEADKVIAGLNDEIHNLKRALINARHEVAKARGKKSSTKKYIAKYSMRQND